MWNLLLPTRSLCLFSSKSEDKGQFLLKDCVHELNAYGKRLELIKENSEWVVFSLGEGKKCREPELYIPSNLDSQGAIQFLEDLFHELATPENPNIQILE